MTSLEVVRQNFGWAGGSSAFPRLFRCIENIGAASALALATALGLAHAQPASTRIEVMPGQLVRWPGSENARCQMAERSWAPIGGTCYFPIDLEHKPGVASVARKVAGRSESARVKVGPRDYGTEEVELPDIPQAHPSPADLKRDASERTILGKVFHRKEGTARFSLPLGKPANPLPPGKAFGVDRVFNGKPAPQPHTGIDYPVPVGSPVLAVADGTVALAQDLFYPGNAVIVDHGDGLFTEYFHLADIKVEVGQDVKKGERIGSIGSTGRATGPHLFFGARWHDARIDPKFVLEDPTRIPEIGVDGQPPTSAASPAMPEKAKRSASRQK
jgi:murein DD-endopeptidase MepM/ murein hydrolase activator NlpD